MTEADIDFSTIEHLDFDVKQSNSIRCIGLTHTRHGVILLDTRDCQNRAVLYAVRGCCGQVSPYCLDCYNSATTGDTGKHIDRETMGKVWIHPVTSPKFSQVHFI